MNDGGRDKLAAQIDWQKRHVHAQLPDKRKHKRFLPRDPRSTIVLADDHSLPCFVMMCRAREPQSGHTTGPHLERPLRWVGLSAAGSEISRLGLRCNFCSTRKSEISNT